MDDLTTASISKKEYIIDVPFTLDEVVCAVKKLKPGKACGPEGVSAEHLKWSGDSLYLWLLGIVNAILEMEEIPSTFKLESIFPVYKGVIMTLSSPTIIMVSLRILYSPKY